MRRFAAALSVCVVCAGCSTPAHHARWDALVADCAAGWSLCWTRAGHFEIQLHRPGAPPRAGALERVEIENGAAWGRDGFWRAQIAQLFSARIELDRLPCDVRLSVWTLDGWVIAAEAPVDERKLLALPAWSGGRIQMFDEDGVGMRAKFISRPVLGGVISSGFGKRRFLGREDFHSAIDIAARMRWGDARQVRPRQTPRSHSDPLLPP